MKKLTLVLIAAIAIGTANAQVQFGVKGGFNFATQTGSDAGYSNTLVNFNAGIYLKLGVAPGFSVQPEMYYSGQGASYDLPGHSTQNEHANYVNIPVLFKWAHRAGPYFETGPQIGFLVGANTTIDGVSSPAKDEYRSTDFAWVFGVGYKIPYSPVGIDFRYNIGLANVEENSVTGFNGTWRNDVLQLGLTCDLWNSNHEGGGRGRGRYR